jgi:hypothetical protein
MTVLKFLIVGILSCLIESILEITVSYFGEHVLPDLPYRFFHTTEASLDHAEFYHMLLFLLSNHQRPANFPTVLAHEV